MKKIFLLAMLTVLGVTTSNAQEIKKAKTPTDVKVATPKAEGAGTAVFCIGVDTDQWFTVPEAKPCLITSAVKGLTLGTSDLVKQAFDGSIAGGNFAGSAGIADYHDFASIGPMDVQDKVAGVVAGLKDGSIKTGVTL